MYRGTIPDEQPLVLAFGSDQGILVELELRRRPSFGTVMCKPSEPGERAETVLGARVTVVAESSACTFRIEHGAEDGPLDRVSWKAWPAVEDPGAPWRLSFSAAAGVEDPESGGNATTG